MTKAVLDPLGPQSASNAAALEVSECGRSLPLCDEPPGLRLMEPPATFL